MKEITCPVDSITVNENQVRGVALGVFLLGLWYALQPGWPLPLFLFADFLLRALRLGKYSPLNRLSGWFNLALHIAPKPVPQAPKIFAAQLGLVMTGLLVCSDLFGVRVLPYGIDGLLLMFSLLEWALAFCAGCYIFSFLKKYSLR